MTSFGRFFRTTNDRPSHDTLPADFQTYWSNMRQGRETDTFITVTNSSPAVLPATPYTDSQFTLPIPEANLFGHRLPAAQMELEAETYRKAKSFKNKLFLYFLLSIVILTIISIASHLIIRTKIIQEPDADGPAEEKMDQTSHTKLSAPSPDRSPSPDRPPSPDSNPSPAQSSYSPPILTFPSTQAQEQVPYKLQPDLSRDTERESKKDPLVIISLDDTADEEVDEKEDPLVIISLDDMVDKEVDDGDFIPILSDGDHSLGQDWENGFLILHTDTTSSENYIYQ